MKRLLLLVSLITTAAWSWADPITERQALRQAQDFLAAKGITMTQQARAKAYQAPGSTATTSPYYIFNAGDNHGFVVVSGDDRTESILGYVSSGTYDSALLPDNFKAWMESYARQIKYLQSHNIQVSRPAFSSAPTTTIQPMLTTKWNQTEPYNNACPTFFTGDKCVTGCVATAMAQLLRYHSQHSSSMTTTICADIPAYYCSTRWNDNQQIHVDTIPSGTTIDWSNMLDSYSGSTTTTQQNAVANLMLYCGAAVQMNYADAANGGSGASSAQVPNALIDYFGFDKSAMVVERSQYSQSDWINTIYNELKSGRPVIYSGTSDSGSGHAFIVHGYEGNYYFDINWGWGGYCDGQFLLSVLAPESGGTGAGDIGSGYNNDQMALINAEPDHGGQAIQKADTKDFTISGSTLSYELYYLGNDLASFDFGVGVRSADGSIKAIGNTYSIALQKNYATSKISFDLSTMGLTAGKTYDIVPIYRVYGQSTWQSMWSPSKYVQATVDASGNISLVEMPQYNLTAANLQVGSVRKANVPMSISADITNKSDESFTGSVYLFASTDASSKGSVVTSGKVALDAGATATVNMGFTPTAAGTYTLWLCSDKGGNDVLAKTDGVVVSEGAAQGGALQVVAVTVNNSDVASMHEDGNYIVTKVSGNDISGKYTLKTLQDITNKNVYVSLYRKGDSGYQLYSGSSSCTTIQRASANATFDMQFSFTNLPEGLYQLHVECGTMNTSTWQMEDVIWSDATYCYEVGVSSGITSLRTNGNASVAIYNLQGVKVAEVPADEVATRLVQLPRGAYIVNGRVVVNRH